MKRFFTLLFAAMLAGQAWAQTTFTVDGLKYTVTNATKHYVSVGRGSTSPTGALEIPSQVTYPETDGVTYTVTSISSSAFSQCNSLTSVIIPNTITSIGDDAFDRCYGLTSISIPNSVKSIGRDAFYICKKLTSLTIPNTVTSIGSRAFMNVKNIIYSGTASGSPWDALTVNGIIDGDFIYSDAEKTLLSAYIGNGGSVTIPNSVASIENNAFYYCSNITSVTIPNSVTNIGAGAFMDCSSLRSVNIPNSVTSIGERPFLRCNSISYKEYGNAYYLGNSENPYLCLIKAKTADINSCDINEKCKFIDGFAFYNCSKLTSVTIPNSVTRIGNDAFAYCSKLTSVNIPNSVTSIGGSAFQGCSSLTSITISNSVTSIGSYAFYNCSSLTTVTIPNSVTSIGSYAFQGCNSLTKTEFASIESLCRIYFADGSANPLSISKILHINGKEVTKVTIPNNVTSIGNYAFHNCSSLTTVTIPNSVTSIGSSAFSNCSGLTTVIIPNSVTSIGNSAFYYVKNIAYSGSASGSPWGALNVNGIIDGDFIYSDESKTNLTAYIGDGGEVEIPGSVTSIGSSAFYGCSGLTTVTIPNSVTSIGSSAFYGCSGLSTVTIPNSVTSIGSYAFYGCRGLTSVTIPNSVTSLSDDVFSPAAA